MSYIYIIHSRQFDINGPDTLYKLGCTNNIKRRIKDSSYTTAFVNPCEYKSVWELDRDTDCFTVEAFIKDELVAHRSDTGGTEMYYISLEELRKVVESVLAELEVKFTRLDLTKSVAKPQRRVIELNTRSWKVLRWLSSRKTDNACEDCPGRAKNKILVQLVRKLNAGISEKKIVCASCAGKHVDVKSLGTAAAMDKATSAVGENISKEYCKRGAWNVNVYADDPYMWLRRKLRDGRALSPKDVQEVDKRIRGYDPHEENNPTRYICLVRAYMSPLQCMKTSEVDYIARKHNMPHLVEAARNAIAAGENSDLIEEGDYFIVREYRSATGRVSAAFARLRLATPKVNASEYIPETITNNSVSILTGGPGRGKSTLVTHNIVPHYIECGYEVVLLAPTAIAAYRLNEMTQSNVESCTIHKILYKQWMYRDRSKPQLIVIDEYSMVDILLLGRLLKKHHSTFCGEDNLFVSEGDTLLFVGDRYQLQPVSGECCVEFLDNLSVPTHELTVSHRFGDKLTSLFDAVAAGDLSGLYRRSPYNDIRTIKAEHQSAVHVNGIVSILFAGVPADGVLRFLESSVVLAPTNKLVGLINAAIRKRLGLSGRFSIGDLVVFTKNNYSCGYINGQRGKIVSITCAGVVGYMEIIIGSQTISVSEEHWEDVQHAYATTVHKAQGASYDSVFFVASWALNADRGMLYTAITRARSRVVIILNNKYSQATHKIPLMYNTRVCYRSTRHVDEDTLANEIAKREPTKTLSDALDLIQSGRGIKYYAISALNIALGGDSRELINRCAALPK